MTKSTDVVVVGNFLATFFYLFPFFAFSTNTQHAARSPRSAAARSVFKKPRDLRTKLASEPAGHMCDKLWLCSHMWAATATGSGSGCSQAGTETALEAMFGDKVVLGECGRRNGEC